MTDLERAEAALIAADKAGDTAAAAALATHIRSLRNAPSAVQGAPTPAGGGQGMGYNPQAPVEGVLLPGGKSDLVDRIKYGLAGVGVQGYLGAKNWFGKLSPEEQNALAQSRADVENSGFAGKAANLAGNVGASVAASMLTPAIALPAALAKFPVLAELLKAGVGSGAMEALTAPAEDQEHILASKAKQAGLAAATGPLVLAAGMGAKKLGTGLFEASKDARDLFAKGINPTLQQAAESKTGKFIGGLTSGFTNTRNRQEQEALDALTNIASGGKIHMPGSTLSERAGALESSVNADEAALMKGRRFPLTKATRDAVLSEADAIKGPQGQLVREQGRARDILDNILGDLPGSRGRLGYGAFRDQYLARIDEALGNPRNGEVVNDALQRARDVLTQSVESRLKPSEIAQLRDIQSRQTDVGILKSLAQGRGGELEGLKIGKLADAYGNLPNASTNATNQELVGPLVRTVGMTPRQDEARTTLNILRTMGKGVGLGYGASMVPGGLPVLGGLYALSSMGQTPLGSKLLTGQTAKQLALKSALESPMTDEVTTANLLRALRDNPYALGSVVGSQNAP